MTRRKPGLMRFSGNLVLTMPEQTATPETRGCGRAAASSSALQHPELGFGRVARPCRWALVAVLVGGSCHEATGLHVFARLGQVQYEALSLAVTRLPDATSATSQVLVDPMTNGRYAGPFKGGDQDVYVYLPDTLDGARVQCSMTALQGSAPIAEGAAEATVHRGAIEDVQIAMGGDSGTGGAGVAGAGGMGGVTAGGTGGASSGGAPGMGGAPASTGGGSGAQKASNGQACNTAGDCASTHCVDGLCCESDCPGACTSCALAGAQGLCRPVAAGVPDPRGICADTGSATCGTNGLCDVSGHCAKYAAGTECAAPSCKNGVMLTQAATCDGSGTCVAGQAVKCSSGCAGNACL